MKFSEDFDKYAEDILHIQNPFKKWFKRLDKAISISDGTITVDIDTSNKQIEKQK